MPLIDLSAYIESTGAATFFFVATLLYGCAAITIWFYIKNLYNAPHASIAGIGEGMPSPSDLS